MTASESDRTTRPYFPDKFLEEHALAAPRSIAIVSEGREITYEELNREANRIGRFLQAHGVGPDVVVAILMPRCSDFIAAVMGIYKAGGACAFLRFDDSPERLRAAIVEINPHLVIAAGSRLAQLTEVRCQVICLDEIELNHFPSTPPESSRDEDSVATVFLTSGSTGKPKVVEFPFGRVSVKSVTHPADERHVLKTDSGTTFTRAEIIHPIIAGGTIFIVPQGMERDAGSLVEYIWRNEISHLICTPSFLQAMILQNGFSLCRSLRAVICSGESIPVELGREFLQYVNAKLTIIYGCTEAPSITSSTFQRPFDGDIIAVGKPTLFADVYILDDKSQPAPAGEEGEICVGGSIAKGYPNDLALTAKKFVTYLDNGQPKRLFRTGDIGRWRESGDLQVIGRQDDQVKVRGFRFQLSEVEASIAAHPSVRFCVVVDCGLGHGKRIVGFFGRKSGCDLSSQGLRLFIERRLPTEMIPHTLIELSEPPLTGSGKIDRALLRVQGAKSLASAPRSSNADLELGLIVNLWERILERCISDLDVNFFDAGGDSLSLSILKQQFEKQFGVDFPMIALSNLTIRQLACALDAQGTISTCRMVVPLKIGGREQSIFFAPGGYGRRFLGGNFSFATRLDARQSAYELLPPEFASRPSITSIAKSCIEGIKSVQAEGPYILAGFSNGGVVAFEIAQLLSRNGDAVSHLFLIDSYLSSAYYPGVWTSGIVAALKGKKVQLRSRAFFRVKKFLAGGKRPVERDLEKLNYHIHRAYSPGGFAGDVYFFYADEAAWRVSHDLLGWRGLLLGKVTLREFSGGHLDLVSGAVATEVSKEIQAILGA